MVGKRRAALAALLLLLAGPLVLGALVAPWVYQALSVLADRVPALGLLQGHLNFRRVASRCVMIAALVLLWPAMRLAGINRLDALGLRGGWSAAMRGLLTGWLVGCVTMAAPYLLGRWLGVYGPDATRAWIREWPALVGYLAGALLVGLLEETLFRGFVFGALRRALRWWPAALCAAALFVAVHLLRPIAPEGLQGRHWLDGFRLAPHLFAGVDRVHLIPTLITLFFMGLTLNRLYEYTGTLWLVMGLHGGWVWVMRSAARMMERCGERWPVFFGQSDQIARTWAGVVMAAIVLASVLAVCSRRCTR